MERAPLPRRQSRYRIALGVAIAVFLIALGIALGWPDRYRVTVAMTLEPPGRSPAEPTSVTEIPIWLSDPYGFPSPWRIDFARVDAFLGDVGTGWTTAVGDGSQRVSATGATALGQTKQQLLSLGRTVLGRRPLVALNRALDVFPEQAGVDGKTSEVIRRMSRNLRVAAEVSIAGNPATVRSSGLPGPAFQTAYAAISGLSLSFEHEDPDIARRVAGRLADEFVESLNSARITGSVSPTAATLAWLTRMAGNRRQEILRLQRRLSTMTPDDPGFPELEQTLTDAGAGLAALETRLLALERERRCRTSGCAPQVRRLDAAQLPATRVGPSRLARLGLGVLAACLSGLGAIAVAGGPRKRPDGDPPARGRSAAAGEGGEA